MQKDLFRKGLVCAILVLLVGMSTIASAGSLSVERVSTDKQIQNSNLGDDTTPPEVEVTWEAYKIDGIWYVDFICDSAEGMSDINRVEMYIDDVIHAMITGPGPEYIFTIVWSKAMKSCTFKFVFYDFAGLSAFVIINGSDIKSYSYSQSSSQQPSFIPSSQSVMNVIPSTGSMVFNNDTTPPVSNHAVDPATPDGENGWYVSDMEVTLWATDDMSGVKAIKYKIGSGGWQSIDQPQPGSPTLCGTFIIDVDGSDLLTEYYAVDYAGNEEEVKSFVIKMDQTPSFGIVTDKNAGFHKIKFTVTVDASDETSGINRVEFWWDDELQHIDYEPPYEWIFTMSHSKEKGTLPILPIVYPFYVFDNAGNVGDSVGDGDPGNKVRFLEQSSPLFFQILQRLMNTR